MKITRLHDSVIGSGPGPRSGRAIREGATLAPGCLDVDDNRLDWAVVDVMMRHRVQKKRPRLGLSSDASGGNPQI